MVGHELTGIGESGYHGYMEPSAEPTPNGQRGTSPEAASNATEGEGDIEPAEVAAREAAESKRRSEEFTDTKRTTNEYLAKLVEQLKKPTGKMQVYSAAEHVLYAARVLKRNLKNLSEKDKKEQEERRAEVDNIIATAEQLVSGLRSKIQSGKIDGDKNARKAFDDQLDGLITGQAGEVASLAKNLKDYFEREKIASEERDPYKPIVSFEELMTKWADVVEERFRPGGEYPLIEVDESVDDFGRIMLKETAHPENFARWVRERVEFYHDFDPYKPINLFQNLYLTVGFRTVQVYEMLVDVPTYFFHREETLGELVVDSEAINTAKGKTFFYDKEFTEKQDRNIPTEPGDVVGYYKIKNEKGEDVEYQVQFEARDTRTGQTFFKVFDKDKDGNYTIPVQAVLQDKDKWQTHKDDKFEVIKDDLLYEVYLLNEAHNYDVAYRMQGMPTQQELKKVMNEIYNYNMFTKNRKRLYKVLHMPATTKRGEETEEVIQFMETEMDTGDQGSVGKAIQRSMMAWYHIGEANATANGYKVEGPNPFEEVLKKGDIDGAEIFYKSLIRQTLEKTFGLKKDQHSVANELVAALNAGRKEYEKAELFDVLVLDRQSLMTELQRRGFTQEQFDTAVRNLQELYQKGDSDKKISPSPEKAKELNRLLESSTLDKKHHLFRSLIGKYEVTEEWLAGKKFVEDKDTAVRKAFEDFWTKDGLEGLDGFAVKFFGRAYDSWGTPDLNVYVNINYDLGARDRVRQALRDALQQTEKLDDFEALYAEEWAFTFTYFTGISARNDLLGIGHDAWAKIINTEFYRLRQTGGGNYPGNLDNLYGIHRLGLDFWEGLTVQEEGSGKLNKTLYEIMMGLEKQSDDTYTMDVNKNIRGFDFHGNAMRQFNADHVGHVIDLFDDITIKHEFNLDKLLAEDNLGRLRWNNEEMQKMIDSTWKHMRYGFDNRNFLYDNPNFGWWYDEKMDKVGAVTRTPHFGLKTIRELMFSDKVRSMRMYEREDVSSWNSKNYGTKMGRNVFAYLIAAQLQQHVHNRNYRLYSADEVATITEAFLLYAARVMRGQDSSAIVLSGFFNPEEMMRILVAGHAILWMLYLKEYTGSAAGGLISGLMEAFALIMKQIGAGIKL